MCYVQLESIQGTAGATPIKSLPLSIDFGRDTANQFWCIIHQKCTLRYLIFLLKCIRPMSRSNRYSPEVIGPCTQTMLVKCPVTILPRKILRVPIESSTGRSEEH